MEAKVAKVAMAPEAEARMVRAGEAGEAVDWAEEVARMALVAKAVKGRGEVVVLAGRDAVAGRGGAGDEAVKAATQVDVAETVALGCSEAAQEGQEADSR